MLDAKQATKRASDYFATLYGENPSSVRLEEVELSDDGRYWLITLSHPSHDQITWNLIGKREYKVFKIDVTTSEVKSMKIRKVE